MEEIINDEIFRDIYYEIYKNIFNMIKYRQGKLIGSPVSIEDFKTIQRTKQYISIEANENIFIMLFADSSLKMSDLYKIINPAIKNSRRESTERISLILNIDTKRNTNIIKILKKIDEDWNSSRIYFEIIAYEQIQINWPECIAYVPHKILDKEDPNIKYILNTHLELPRIAKNDTGTLWCGGKPGDIIEVRRLNNTIAYRIVIDGLI